MHPLHPSAPLPLYIISTPHHCSSFALYLTRSPLPHITHCTHFTSPTPPHLTQLISPRPPIIAVSSSYFTSLQLLHLTLYHCTHFTSPATAPTSSLRHLISLITSLHWTPFTPLPSPHLKHVPQHTCLQAWNLAVTKPTSGCVRIA